MQQEKLLKIMKSTNLLTGLLALLGFQLQSCDIYEGTDAYGCPYSTFKTKGTVKDSQGNKIQDAKVLVKIDGIVTKEDSTGVKTDTIWSSNRITYSDRKGVYENNQRGEDSYLLNEVLHFDVITEKEGYESDTIHKEVKRSELKKEKGAEWETLRSQEINVVLKKK